MAREISREQAEAACQILVEECGHRQTDDGYNDFVETVRTDGGRRHVCNEYRFMGRLGFGGKFRNNGNRNNTPYVDCYREHETPERLAMIERTNERLAVLFAPSGEKSLSNPGER
ncbi:hypothetical protein [Bauldia litoralis]|uniref:hypothetical protein n=1 Tax=Bauldia litoralis TaxID=665467 RepID=UPI00326586C2